MKAKRFIISVAITLLSQMGMSQTPGITIYMAAPGDSSNNVYCSTPAEVPLMMYGSAIGYLPNDSVAIQIAFGDGQDTLYKIPIVQNSWFSTYVLHKYNFAGSYSLQYIATGPDSDADTVTAYNQFLVSDTCGNASGYAFIDTDGDCVFDLNETSLSGLPVVAMLGAQVVAQTYTNQNGYYSFELGIGSTYTITMGNNISSYGYSITCPSLGYYTVSTLPADNNFGLSCVNGFDLEAGISGWGFRPGFTGYVYPFVQNNYCNPVSGVYKVVLDPLLTYVSSSVTPMLISGDTLFYNFSNLNNLSTVPYTYITVTTSVGAVLGDSICLEIIAEPQFADVNPLNNIEYQCFEIRNSWDPNEKEVSPAGEGVTGNIAPSTTLNYTVHFQNTGTAEAYNIFILDTLDLSLDYSTFEIVAYSHPMTMNILDNNVVKFNFNNIMLPDSNTNEPQSHGFVTYRIHTKPALTDGTEIRNTAGIYFDFNPAIITNTTLNTISTIMGVEENTEILDNIIQLFPVPADEFVTISVKTFNKIDNIQIKNSQGQLVYSSTNSSKSKIIYNTSNLKSGIYSVSVKCGNNIETLMFSVIH